MLFDQLQPFFRENGFQSDAGTNIFRHFHPDGWSTVQVSERPQATGQLVKLQLGIRHTLVEEIVYPFALGLSSSGEAEHTLRVSQAQINGEVDRPEWIRDEADEVLVARQWQQWMLEKGLAWLDIYGQTVWLDRLYNDEPETAARWQPAAFQRSLRAVALAYLTQRVDFRSIVQRGKRDLAEAEAAPELLLRLDGLVSALP